MSADPRIVSPKPAPQGFWMLRSLAFFSLVYCLSCVTIVSYSWLTNARPNPLISQLQFIVEWAILAWVAGVGAVLFGGLGKLDQQLAARCGTDLTPNPSVTRKLSWFLIVPMAAGGALPFCMLDHYLDSLNGEIKYPVALLYFSNGAGLVLLALAGEELRFFFQRLQRHGTALGNSAPATAYTRWLTVLTAILGLVYIALLARWAWWMYQMQLGSVRQYDRISFIAETHRRIYEAVYWAVCLPSILILVRSMEETLRTWSSIQPHTPELQVPRPLLGKCVPAVSILALGLFGLSLLLLLIKIGRDVTPELFGSVSIPILWIFAARIFWQRIVRLRTVIGALLPGPGERASAAPQRWRRLLPLGVSLLLIQIGITLFYYVGNMLNFFKSKNMGRIQYENAIYGIASSVAYYSTIWIVTLAAFEVIRLNIKLEQE